MTSTFAAASQLPYKEIKRQVQADSEFLLTQIKNFLENVLSLNRMLNNRSINVVRRSGPAGSCSRWIRSNCFCSPRFVLV